MTPSVLLCVVVCCVVCLFAFASANTTQDPNHQSEKIRDILQSLSADAKLQVRAHARRESSPVDEGNMSLDKCPHKCYMRGTCINARCLCDFPYTGVDCSGITDACPGDCSQHGICVSGECLCDDGFGGYACDETIRCPRDCNGHGVCLSGTCQCDAGYSGIDCAVFESLCPNACWARGRCQDGVCVCDAGWTGVDCATSRPGRNITVAQRSVLEGCSSLILPEDPTCQSRFVRWDLDDLKLDTLAENAMHLLTSLSMDCPFNNGQLLLRQLVCANAIPAFSMKIRENLPVCSSLCALAVQACEMGNMTSDRVMQLCDSSAKNCEQVCTPALAPCPLGCSSNGRCSLSGICTCNSGYFGDGCQNKYCSNNCTSSVHGTCEYSTGRCFCKSPWTTADCSVAQCMNDCSHHGECSQKEETAGKCICNTGWKNKDCSEPICPNNCTKHGKCQENGVCVCDEGYRGVDCSYVKCANECSGHGQCTQPDGICKCESGWSTIDCSIKQCPHDCSSHGVCDFYSGRCNCTYPFIKEDRSEALCPRQCSNHGTCNTKSGVCVCNTHWGSDDCGSPICPGNCTGHGRFDFPTLFVCA
eukprot:c6252_g1_i1.p1 GENE.c6252_g1_i1~~c6252_g1_i1.p1  ORF type:complete len:588 (+),score=99.91 c6252_g1_i1:96-1859(+)